MITQELIDRIAARPSSERRERLSDPAFMRKPQVTEAKPANPPPMLNFEKLFPQATRRTVTKKLKAASVEEKADQFIRKYKNTDEYRRQDDRAQKRLDALRQVELSFKLLVLSRDSLCCNPAAAQPSNTLISQTSTSTPDINLRPPRRRPNRKPNSRPRPNRLSQQRPTKPRPNAGSLKPPASGTTATPVKPTNPAPPTNAARPAPSRPPIPTSTSAASTLAKPPAASLPSATPSVGTRLGQFGLRVGGRIIAIAGAAYGAYEGFSNAEQLLNKPEDQISTSDRIASAYGGAVNMINPLGIIDAAASLAGYETDLANKPAQLLGYRNTNEAFVDLKDNIVSGYQSFMRFHLRVGEHIRTSLKRGEERIEIQQQGTELVTKATDSLNQTLKDKERADKERAEEQARQIAALRDAGGGVKPTTSISSWINNQFTSYNRPQNTVSFNNTATPTNPSPVKPNMTMPGLNAPSQTGGASAMIGGTLGSVAGKYESRGNYGTIGNDSTGGYSYGKYQIATKTGTFKKFMEFLKDKYPQHHATLVAAGGDSGAMQGSPGFIAAFKKLAENPEFQQAQDAYIKMSHYDPAVSRLNEKLGIDIGNSRALQEMMFSLSVQHGPGGAIKLIKNALSGKDVSKLSETDIIKLVYAERSKVDRYFASSTAQVQQSVRNRFGREQNDILALAEAQRTGQLVSANQPAQPRPTNSTAAAVTNTVSTSDSSQQTAALSEPIHRQDDKLPDRPESELTKRISSQLSGVEAEGPEQEKKKIAEAQALADQVMANVPTVENREPAAATMEQPNLFNDSTLTAKDNTSVMNRIESETQTSPVRGSQITAQLRQEQSIRANPGFTAERLSSEAPPVIHVKAPEPEREFRGMRPTITTVPTQPKLPSNAFYVNDLGIVIANNRAMI